MTYTAPTEIAKVIRKELKASFAGIKFSVRSSSGAVRISWTDGPSTKQVEAITNKHQSVRRCERTGDILGGGNIYVTCNRELSQEMKDWAKQVFESKNYADDCFPAYRMQDVLYSIASFDPEYTACNIEYRLIVAMQEIEAAKVEEIEETETEVTEEIDTEKQARIEAYQSKIEARKDYYAYKAHKANQESNARFNQAKAIGSHIPFGQPILVGHHSESHHRADIKRIDTNMRKSIEASDKADYYSTKANSVGSAGINSDDPEALDKLKEKLAGMEANQTYMKECNKLIRKVLNLISKEKLTKESAPQKLLELAKSANVDITSIDLATTLLFPTQRWMSTGFAGYQLSNNSQNMKRVKERIAELEIVSTAETKEYLVNDIKVVENVEENRIQVFFGYKPEKHITKFMRSHGYNFSRYNGNAWQRKLNPSAIKHTDWVLNNLPEA